MTFYAKVAELADALDLGSSRRKLVGVQVPSFAPVEFNPIFHKKQEIERAG